MSLIAKLTKDCQREDCQIIGGNSSVSTYIAWTPTYDKSGKRTDRGDPNWSTTSYSCITCRAGWSVTRHYDETTISLDKEPTNEFSRA
jgi:hypothetical protein